MTEKMLAAIHAARPLTERDAGDYAAMNVSGVAFTVRCFTAAGLGNVSLMHGEIPGVMAMDTVVIDPFERDMPLFSYDRVYAGPKDTLFLELYDTRLDYVPDTGKLAQIVASFSDLSTGSFASCWYDGILYGESVRKDGTAEQTPRMDGLTEAYLDEYLRLCALAPKCDPALKRKAASVYTEGLLNNGGVSTDNFLRNKGKAFTQGLFRGPLFGTGDPERDPE